MAAMRPPASNPRVADSGATFTWHGPPPAPVVVGSWCDWDPARGLAMRRSGDHWTAHVELPPDAYVEYGLLIDGRAVPDPGNPHRVGNGVGGRTHRFWMPAARRHALALARRRVPRGEVTMGSVDMGWLAAPPLQRRLALYLPHVAAADTGLRRDLPLLLVLDGLDYLRRGKLARILDALIADGAMAPVAAAFLDNAGRTRATEYAANDFTLATVADIVVPAVVERLGLAPQQEQAGPGRAAISARRSADLWRSTPAFGGWVGRVIAQSTAESRRRPNLGFTTLPPPA
jgi:enterochelin esterase family protein